jgi:hypothetical protein
VIICALFCPCLTDPFSDDSGADTKAEVLTMPGGDPVISSEEDDPVSTAYVSFL